MLSFFLFVSTFSGNVSLAERKRARMSREFESMKIAKERTDLGEKAIKKVIFKIFYLIHNWLNYNVIINFYYLFCFHKGTFKAT